MLPTKHIYARIPAVIFAAGILFSCVNDLESIRKINADPNAPNETSTGLKLLYTDSGFAKIQIFASIAETYTKPEICTKLRGLVKVNFFNNDGEIVSILTSKYAEINDTKKLMFVRDSVQLYNPIKQQRLETEELIWNQTDSTIVSNKQVIIRNKEGVLYGDGVKTNQNFDKYTFLKPRGKALIK